MERRFNARRRKILQQAQVDPRVYHKMIKRLEQFTEPFVVFLKRPEPKAHARRYLAGLLSDLERKNVESIAYRHDQERQNLQHFVGSSPWPHAPLIDELVRQVGQELGETDGVIVFDPSAHQKCGCDSVGVARQWLGRLGKVDNGQVGVYMGYSSRKESALVDTRLYLPKAWAKDRRRRKKCGVPKEIQYRTRHELALDMLKLHGRHLPHAWIAGDDEMGRSSRFRRDLRALDEKYLLAAPSNTLIRDLSAAPPPYSGHGQPPKPPFQRVDRRRDQLTPSAWTRHLVRDGEKGPLIVEIATVPVEARTEQSQTAPAEELLVVARTQESNGNCRHDYYLSNAPADVSPAELARVIKAAHRIEDNFKRAKSEAGLSDYEVRTWAGWYHHQTLSLIATWFLIGESLRGKKVHPGDHGAADSDVAGPAAAAGVRPSFSGLVSSLGKTQNTPQRVSSLSTLQKTEVIGSA
jgi:SRSO17 transposase